MHAYARLTLDVLQSIQFLTQYRLHKVKQHDACKRTAEDLSPNSRNKHHAAQFGMIQREGSVSFVQRPANLWYAVAQLVEVAGSIPDGFIGIFHSHNPSDRTIALGLTQHLTEMSTWNISCG